MKKEELINIAYKFYPRGINFLTEKSDTNPNYLKSMEYQRLENKRARNFDLGNSFGQEVIKLLKENGIPLEFRDITGNVADGTSFLIQHSDFFYEDELKYYPLCIAFSGLVPYYYFYFVDIDISFEPPIILGSYNWKSNNGLLVDWYQDSHYFKLMNLIMKTLEDNLNFKLLDKSLINQVIPEIANHQIDYGNMTIFNAFFLDNYYCAP